MCFSRTWLQRQRPGAAGRRSARDAGRAVRGGGRPAGGALQLDLQQVQGRAARAGGSSALGGAHLHPGLQTHR
jgi:hypothetical protein